MKQKCKRLTALVLALAMCLSLLSTTAWAAEFSAEAENAAEEVQEDSDPVTEEEDASAEAETAAEEVQEDSDPATEEEEASAEAETAAEEVQEDSDPATEEEDASAEAETATEEVQEDSDPATEEESASDEGDVSVSASSVTTETYTYINPEYADVITEDDLVKPSEDEGDTAVSAASDVEYCTTDEERVELLREGLKSREITIIIYYKSSSSAFPSDVFGQAVTHTGDPEEGDYLAWQWGGYSVGTSQKYSSGNYYYTITYTMTYYTTAEQEAEVTARLDEVMEELDLDDKCDYEKIQAIYDYICDNVTYDYTNLNDDDYMLKYTAYAALINGTSVCQGYALLFYRMALEAGVDARFISGTGNGGGHGWNIVQLGDVYYNVDSTWDAGRTQYSYFLRSNGAFGTSHVRDSEYSTDEFNEAYPMATSNYTLTSDSSHSWGSPAFTWSSDYSTCTAAFTCAAEDSTRTLDCTVTSAVTTAATCTTAGEETYTAAVTFDGQTYTDTQTETIPATGHTEGEAVTENQVAATCSEDGSYDSVVYCTVCEAELSRETITVNATGHTWDDGVVVTEATCDDPGEKLYTCTVCQAAKTETIPATGHTFGEPTFEWADDHSSAKAIFACEDEECDNTETVLAEVSVHITEATCTEDGKTVYTAIAAFDGVDHTDTQTVPISATGHSYESVVTKATCTEGGYTTYTCADCGDSYTADETEALGHSYDGGKVTTEATCTEDGVKTYTCTACGGSYTEIIPATGHTEGEAVTENQVAATCTEDGSYDSVVYCTVCETELSRETVTVNATGHTFVDRVCITCGAKEVIDLSGYDVTVASATYTGSVLTPDVAVTDANGNTLTEGTDYNVECTETLLNAGSYTLTITGINAYTGSAPATFTIAPASISGYTVTAANATYTGKAQTPTVTVKNASGNILTSGTDYTFIVNGGNNAVNAGSYTVTVTGTGNYTGTKTATFTIAKASQTVTATAAASSIYAGKTTTVTGKGTGTITYKSSDTSVATVSTSGKVTGKKPGTVTITVQAAGNSNYNSATKTVKITVKLNKTTISSLTNTSKGVTVKWSKVTGASGYYIYRNGTQVKKITSGSTVSFADTGAKTNGTKYQYKIYAYYGSTKSAVSSTKTIYYVSAPTISSLKNSASKKMTVKWGKNAKATGYQIQYSTSSSFSSSKTVTVSGASTVSKAISNLTKGKKYYVRVRAYKTVSGTKYYSAWSSTKSVKISK